MRRRIFWNMVVVAAVAVLLAGLIGVILGQVFVAQEGRRDMVRQADAARVVLAEQADLNLDGARLVERLAVFGDDEANARFTEMINATRRLLGNERFDVVLVDRDGEVVLLSDRSPDPYGIDAETLLAGDTQFVTVLGDPRLLVYVRPLVDQATDGVGGRMAVIVPREAPVIPFDTVLRGMLITLGLVSVMAAVAARYISRGLAQNLDRVSDAAKAIAAGNLGVRAPVDGDDEVATLGAAFNDMAEELTLARAREREFLMSVGHDLRTPLTTIAGYAEMLEEGGIDEPEMERVAGVLAFETARLRRLVEDIMLLARLEAREFTLEPESVDVGAHLGELATGFGRRAEQERVRLDVEIGATGELMVDPDRIAQLTANLLENALRYTPEAGRVGLSVARIEGGVAVTVTDSGPGIEEQDLPRVFDKLYVARRYRSVRPEGSGLGLAIVKQLTDAMDGVVEVTSAPGEGTTICVSIPA